MKGKAPSTRLPLSLASRPSHIQSLIPKLGPQESPPNSISSFPLRHYVLFMRTKRVRDPNNKTFSGRQCLLFSDEDPEAQEDVKSLSPKLHIS